MAEGVHSSPGRPRPRKPGRPGKLTPELMAKIVGAIRAGNYVETAAAANGVAKETLYAWMRQGSAAKTGIYKEFSDAINTAWAEAEAGDVALIGRAALNGAWQAAAWRLERKFPDRFGKKDRLELGGSVVQQHSGAVAAVIATDEQASKLAHDLLARIAAQAGGEQTADGSGDGGNA